MWSSLEDAGTLVDCLCPQADILVLELLSCAVHGLRNQATFGYLTLPRRKADKNVHQNGSVKEIAMWAVMCPRKLNHVLKNKLIN